MVGRAVATIVWSSDARNIPSMIPLKITRTWRWVSGAAAGSSTALAGGAVVTGPRWGSRRAFGFVRRELGLDELGGEGGEGAAQGVTERLGSTTSVPPGQRRALQCGDRRDHHHRAEVMVDRKST